MSIVLGLTGSIGMGKSTVAAMFRKLHVPVFDADAQVQRLQGPNGLLVAAIEAFHPGTSGPLGIDRARLAGIIFGDKVALGRLEQLIHPRVEDARRAFLRRHRAAPLVVVDIPLLFEKGGWRRVDLIAVVSAPMWKQRARVLARPGMTWLRLAQLRRLQLPDHVKRRRADFVVPTGGTINRTRTSVRRIVACVDRGMRG